MVNKDEAQLEIDYEKARSYERQLFILDVYTIFNRF